MSVEVTFSVEVDTLGNEGVRLVGDDSALGSWLPSESIGLERQLTNENSNVWLCTVTLEKDSSYEYRFFVTKERNTLGNDGDSVQKVPIVMRWETNIKPRQFVTNGADDRIVLPVATFGEYGGGCHIGKGWLIDQNEVHIRLHSNPIYMWKSKHRVQTYSVKCMAMDYAETEGMSVSFDEDSRDGPSPCSYSDVSVSALSDTRCRPGPQEPFGKVYHPNDFMVFRTQTFNLPNLGFQLDFFVYQTKELSKYVGSCHVLPVDFSGSRLTRKLPIIGCNHKPIGEVTVDMLVARPVPGLKLTMETCYKTHRKWRKPDNKSLDIGHRGMGASYTQFSMLKENTIASFSGAGEHGADFVEFDVILSKDLRPVIYHDFFVHVSYSNKQNHTQQNELHEIPVKSLTLKQLQSMRLFFAGTERIEINAEDDVLSTHAPFPTLERCLQEVDENMGFNIEIKYPQQDQNGIWESENYFDVNENLDHILKVVFEHVGTRKIIFSCFDPDTTVLLQMKQNRYPVMFLHQGQSKRWTPYKEFRANTFNNGIRFAYCEELLGVALLSELLLDNTSIIQEVHQQDLVLFVWGNENNDPKVIRKLRDLNVDGIIYDRIDYYKPEHQPEFALQSEKDAAVFQSIVNAEAEAAAANA